MNTTTPDIDQLIELLRLEAFERYLFRGRTPVTQWGRVYGGHVLAQALIAAGSTVRHPEGSRFEPHSLHGYFLRAGESGTPIVYEVDPIRDGRSFVTRRVLALQHGKAIFSMDASFQRPEPGLEHQVNWPIRDPGPPPPTDAASTGMAGTHYPELAIVAIEDLDAAAPPSVNEWIRFRASPPDDPLLHAALLAWFSDMAMLPVARRPLAEHWGSAFGMGASLDHALWFHRPISFDDWIYAWRCTQRARNEQYLVEGQYFDTRGRLLASVMQESLNRLPTPAVEAD